jgi:hypothetical protein
VTAGLYLLGCTPDAERATRHFEPPPLAHPAGPARRQALEYSLAPASRVSLALVEKRRLRLEGELPVAAGHVWLDANDLASTRAEATFDLAALELWTSGSSRAPKGAAASTPTEQSLDWLQLSTEQDQRLRPELRYARFTLLAIGSSSSNDLDAAPAVRSGQSAVVARRVRLRASGELELHGHRLPQTVSVEATFEWTAPLEPGAPPRRILLETSEPVEIDLPGYGIVPRDARGELLADGLAELRRSPRKQLQVRARWLAEPAGAAAESAAPGAGPAARGP